MKNVYYAGIVDFINQHNININNRKQLRKGLGILNTTMYSNGTNGNLKSLIETLEDIAKLDENLLEYPIGTGLEMVMVNIMLEAKGMFANLGKTTELYITSNNSNPYFEVILVFVDIEYDRFNNQVPVFNKVKISTNRTMIVTSLENVDNHSKKIIDFINKKFTVIAKSKM